MSTGFSFPSIFEHLFLAHSRYNISLSITKRDRWITAAIFDRIPSLSLSLPRTTLCLPKKQRLFDASPSLIFSRIILTR